MNFGPKIQKPAHAKALEEQMRDDPAFAKTVHELEAKFGGKISDQLIDTAEEPIREYAPFAEEAWGDSRPYGDHAVTEGQGLNPVAAIFVALWYSVTAAAAMSMGFAFLHQGSPDNYSLVQNLMWCTGIGIGVAFGVCLVRSHWRTVGTVSSLILSALLLSLLFLNLDGQASEIRIFNFWPSMSQLVIAIAALTLLCGLFGTAIGKAARDERNVADALLGVRLHHWLWLWIALYAWVAIVPTALYYIWLEIVSALYVVIHPSLWLAEAWDVGWTTMFGVWGFIALFYGIELSLKNLSPTKSAGRSWGKRFGLFLLGTFVLVGPVANILFRIAIHSLKHLPDGITTNPWWVLR